MSNPVVHFEIGCRDKATTEQFYSKLFAWTLSPMGPATMIDTGAGGMMFDTLGNLYVATNLGIQICDQPGRVNGIVRRPGPGNVTSVVFGGADLKTLYVTVGPKSTGARYAAPEFFRGNR